MTENRPSIPAHIKRSVLVEAGHRCAIPTCRYIETEIHHIIPWSQCQTHDYTNLIALCINCHKRADRNEIDRRSLHLYKSNLRFAHDKYSQLEIDVLFEASKLNSGDSLIWNPHSLLLLKRLLDSQFIDAIKSNVHMVVGQIDSTPLLITLTELGKQFLETLSSSDIENA